MYSCYGIHNTSANRLFTALHLCRERSYSHERNVCLSVCLSVRRVTYDKTKETSVYILYHMKDRSSSFFGGDDPLYLEILLQTDRVPSKTSIFGHSASAVTPSEKSPIIINRKSITRAFQ